MTLRSRISAIAQDEFTISFISDLPEYEFTKPYYFSGDLPPDMEASRTNLKYEQIAQIPISNLRGYENTLTLEEYGFEFLKLAADVVALDVRGHEKVRYLECVTDIVRDRFKADFVLCYDCRFRSSSKDTASSQHAPTGTATRPDIPSEAAHIDHTHDGAINRARRHMTTEEAKKYLNAAWRLRIVNLWRPLATVENHDLVCCDHSSVKAIDLLPVDRVSSEYLGEVYMLKPRTHYDWYWIDHQKADEATLFISHDSIQSADAPFCPHTSSDHRGADELVEPRESVELRFLVLTQAP